MLAYLVRNWWVLRGIVAVLFGVVAWIWPDLTVPALVILFGALALAVGARLIGLAFRLRRWGDRIAV